ncbi:364_t:CDS:2 [Ambispora gerdemannii]|uniref:364_t:CDS:1 n=1 Tax=Ambispora gerdemannii TaxID=144530 RepID=A0A9N9GV43_9GLOM|nr:364_t:CDS:2 [Ambispora gerdemannii]
MTLTTEKHDGFGGFSNTFRELDYFIRHYQNSTEELVNQIKQLKSEKASLETENAKLKEELTIERETNQESAEVMDNFYRRQFIANQTPDILQEFSTDYLKVSWENQAQKQKIKDLEQTIEINNKLLEQQFLAKETQEQAIQTELTCHQINQLEKKQKAIQKTVLALTEQLVDLQIQEEQTEAQIEVPPKFGLEDIHGDTEEQSNNSFLLRLISWHRKKGHELDYRGLEETPAEEETQSPPQPEPTAQLKPEATAETETTTLPEDEGYATDQETEDKKPEIPTMPQSEEESKESKVNSSQSSQSKPTSAIVAVKEQILTNLKENCLTTSDLPPQYQNWEEQLTNLENEEEIEAFMQVINQQIEQRAKELNKENTNQEAKKQPSTSLTTKMLLGGGIAILLVVSFLVLIRKSRKKQNFS